MKVTFKVGEAYIGKDHGPFHKPTKEFYIWVPLVVDRNSRIPVYAARYNSLSGIYGWVLMYKDLELDYEPINITDKIEASLRRAIRSLFENGIDRIELLRSHQIAASSQHGLSV